MRGRLTPTHTRSGVGPSRLRCWTAGWNLDTMTTIRRATPADAEPICELHKESIRSLCRSSYSPEQIDAWTKPLQPDLYLPAMESLEFFVAESPHIVGFVIVDLAGGELNALYVLPSTSGHGIGTELLLFAEDLARRRSLSALTLKSTLNAAGFYQSRGFRPIRRTVHVNPAGLELPCVEMSKALEIGSADPPPLRCRRPSSRS